MPNIMSAQYCVTSTTQKNSTRLSTQVFAVNWAVPKTADVDMSRAGTFPEERLPRQTTTMVFERPKTTVGGVLVTN